MTLTDMGIVVAISTPLLAGAGYVGKLYGDTLWMPINIYQQEKLYDLQDEHDDLKAVQQFERELTQRERQRLQRLERRIERLEDQLK